MFFLINILLSPFQRYFPTVEELTTPEPMDTMNDELMNKREPITSRALHSFIYESL